MGFLAIVLKNLWVLKTGKVLVLGYLLLVIATFIYFYPHVAAILVSTTFNDSYFWLNTWR
ncbi:hypothetical protein A3D81_02695 [Candidatus Curtissbacteria bacterium RIFCSPHIGHO2_02_FULL_40_17]|uniref:Uncharacterized protein n=1 Tax=Candidatus Curtissbacteria bacterium RIFCSPHIGHO2_02_FULL_40_17 TaxID=1797715 RepID=A0A1F5GJC4_9BACT|nr:MAG: hypothetical protein A3D81_02695 [Candidatus Curtissbacteria bacterium RIFCSPHIGHO2_02_FULL_40_17]